MDETLYLFLVPDGLQVEHFLYAFDGLDLMGLMLDGLVDARDTDDGLVVLAVEVEKVFVIAANRLVS